MMEPVSQQEFEEMIHDALDTLPAEFARHMTNMVGWAGD